MTELLVLTAHAHLHKDSSRPPLDVTSQECLERQEELITDEEILIITLGLSKTIVTLPHSHILFLPFANHPSRKLLGRTAYGLATSTLYYTTMTLQYPATVVACVCVHVASKYRSVTLPESPEGRPWFYFADKTLTMERLEVLSADYMAVLERHQSPLTAQYCNVSNTSPTGEHGSRSESVSQSMDTDTINNTHIDNPTDSPTDSPIDSTTDSPNDSTTAPTITSGAQRAVMRALLNKEMTHNTLCTCVC